MMLARVLAKHKTPATRERRTPGVFDQAIAAYTGDSTEAVGISGVFQPVKGNARMELPEGVRDKAEWMVWSMDEILVDDVIVRTTNGDRFRVLYVQPREAGGFWRAALEYEVP